MNQLCRNCTHAGRPKAIMVMLMASAGICSYCNKAERNVPNEEAQWCDHFKLRPCRFDKFWERKPGRIYCRKLGKYILEKRCLKCKQYKGRKLCQ